MKRIVLVNRPIHPVPPQKGAAVEWMMFQVAQRLRSYEPHIISICGRGQVAQEYSHGIQFHRIDVGRLYRRVCNKWLGIDPYPYAQRVAGLVESIRPEILHFLNAHELLDEVCGRLSFRPKRISHLQNDFPLSLHPNLDLVVTCSDYLSRLYRERFRYEVDVRTVYNGADVGAFDSARRNREAAAKLRARLGIPARARVVLFVGRISPEKGVEVLLEAFSRLVPEFDDVYVVLVGELRMKKVETGDRRFEYSQEILRRCRALTPRAIAVGVVPPVDVPAYYAIGDVAVFPSTFEEPFGMVAIEAMAAGLPVIVSNRGGFPEYVADGVNGMVLDRDRPVDDLVKRLRALLSDPALAERLGKAGRRTVEERFTWERVAAEIEQTYDSLLKG